MLSDGLAWLSDTLAEHAATTVRYSRGASSVEVPATFGAKLLKVAGMDGMVRMEWTDMDFLIKASLLVLDGERVTPEKHDRITVAMPYDEQTFEVLPYGVDGSEPAWRWSDPHQSMLRIHAKCIDLDSIR
jgi:hypothetical protein